MNLSLLLQWWGFAGGDFLKPLAYFLPVHSAKKPCTWRNVVLKIPTKWDFSRFLGQAFDWLSAVNRAKTSLQVLLHLSPEKKGKLTGVLHADRLTWEAGDLFSLHVTLRLQGEREREISRERAAGNPASWQEFSMEWGCRNCWDLTCKRVRIQAKRILFLFKIKWRLFFPVELLVQIQLVPSYVRSTEFKLSLSLCHISHHLIYIIGGKAQLCSELQQAFSSKFVFIFLSFVKMIWNAKFGHERKEYLSVALKLRIQLKWGLRFKELQTHATWNSINVCLGPWELNQRHFTSPHSGIWFTSFPKQSSYEHCVLKVTSRMNWTDQLKLMNLSILTVPRQRWGQQMKISVPLRERDKNICMP